MSRTTIIGYATAIFFALALGGLIVLRRQLAIGTRVVVFLVFCAVCVYVTLWTTNRWQLLMGEGAIAWVVALLLVAMVEGAIRLRKGKRIGA